MEDKYLTPEEASKILKVDTMTIYRWLKQGILRGVKIGGLWRIRTADIELYPEKIVTK